MRWKPLPSIDALKSRIKYDPDTGVFHWTFYSRAQRYDGVAGRPCPRGYIRIQHEGQNVQLHRAAWLFMTGDDPGPMQIDHRDGNKSNNRWRNLRKVPPQINSQNKRGPASNNASGYLGVSLDKRCGLYRATIKAGGKQKCLGYFVLAEDASKAYLRAKRVLHPGCTI